MNKKIVLVPFVVLLVLFSLHFQNKLYKAFFDSTSTSESNMNINHSFANASNSVSNSNELALFAEDVYELIDFTDESKPSLLTFSESYKAYKNLVIQGVVENNYLTIIDFSLSSSMKRLWVIDMKTLDVVLNELVAHGQNTGQEYATKFSNKPNSHQSSLGIYLTGEVYSGRNGLSLRLDGLNVSYNDNARARGIVIHGADYVSSDFIANNGRLGRSQGCPAVSEKVNAKLIDLIKEKSVLFIYHPTLDSAIAQKTLKTLNLQGIEKRNI